MIVFAGSQVYRVGDWWQDRDIQKQYMMYQDRRYNDCLSHSGPTIRKGSVIKVPTSQMKGYLVVEVLNMHTMLDYSVYKTSACEIEGDERELYLPKRKPKFSSRSVARELSLAIKELFLGLGISKIKVESRLEMSVQNFTSDLIKCFDEVTDPSDIVKLWHVSDSLATDLYSVCEEVMKFEPGEEKASVNDSYEDGDELSSSEESFVSLSNDGPDTSLPSEEL